MSAPASLPTWGYPPFFPTTPIPEIECVISAARSKPLVPSTLTSIIATLKSDPNENADFHYKGVADCATVSGGRIWVVDRVSKVLLELDTSTEKWRVAKRFAQCARYGPRSIAMVSCKSDHLYIISSDRTAVPKPKLVVERVNNINSSTKNRQLTQAGGIHVVRLSNARDRCAPSPRTGYSVVINLQPSSIVVYGGAKEFGEKNADPISKECLGNRYQCNRPAVRDAGCVQRRVVSELWTFDLTELQWRKIREPKLQTCGPESNSCGEYLHAVPSFLASGFNPLNRELSWPSARMEHSAVRLGRSMVVFGGMAQHASDDENKKILLNDCWVLDLNSVQWKQVTPLGRPPCGRCQHVAVIGKRNTMCIFGGNGIYNNAFVPLSDMYLMELVKVTTPPRRGPTTSSNIVRTTSDDCSSDYSIDELSGLASPYSSRFQRSRIKQDEFSERRKTHAPNAFDISQYNRPPQFPSGYMGLRGDWLEPALAGTHPPNCVGTTFYQGVWTKVGFSMPTAIRAPIYAAAAVKGKGVFAEMYLFGPEIYTVTFETANSATTQRVFASLPLASYDAATTHSSVRHATKTPAGNSSRIAQRNNQTDTKLIFKDGSDALNGKTAVTTQLTTPQMKHGEKRCLKSQNLPRSTEKQNAHIGADKKRGQMEAKSWNTTHTSVRTPGKQLTKKTQAQNDIFMLESPVN
eukprot:GHVT01086201.1.p1 GENE.GHVT01086201.1~~GHVT01086201.1.p1  ORF type:complete len:738 (+),score=41.26 GHVT01086201.1:143-2215(+)